MGRVGRCLPLKPWNGRDFIKNTKLLCFVYAHSINWRLALHRLKCQSQTINSCSLKKKKKANSHLVPGKWLPHYQSHQNQGAAHFLIHTGQLVEACHAKWLRGHFTGHISRWLWYISQQLYVSPRVMNTKNILKSVFQSCDWKEEIQGHSEVKLVCLFPLFASTSPGKDPVTSLWGWGGVGKRLPWWHSKLFNPLPHLAVAMSMHLQNPVSTSTPS